jgi:preprotein translocase subunit SecY
MQGTGRTIQATGKVLVFITSLLNPSNPGSLVTASIAFASIAATVLVFFIVVYTQSIKVEVPLSFGRIRGMNVRWPLFIFLYKQYPCYFDCCSACKSAACCYFG